MLWHQKIFVVDQNFYRSDELKVLFETDRSCKFVIPDAALLAIIRDNLNGGIHIAIRRYPLRLHSISWSWITVLRNKMQAGRTWVAKIIVRH